MGLFSRHEARHARPINQRRWRDLRNARMLLGVEFDSDLSMWRLHAPGYPDAWYPVAGSTVTVETTGDVDRRMTATRMVLTGPFAAAWTKRTDLRQMWVTIGGAYGSLTFPVDLSVKYKDVYCYRFASVFSLRAAELATADATGA